MEPKFQSSFIPKGPSISSNAPAPSTKPISRGGILGLIATILFVISLVLALGAVGYKFYLKNRISNMGAEIENAQGNLYSASIKEIIRLNDRMVSTKTLLDNHIVLSPLFDFLEKATLKTVRFSDFSYSTGADGATVRLRGQARSYSAVALQSDIFNASGHFKSPVFSDLDLDERGNIVFTFTANINPDLLSYKKMIEKDQTPISSQSGNVSRVNLAATSTATSTSQASSRSATTTATSTPTQ